MLNDRLIGPAGVFGPRDPDDAELRGNPVEHLADALADGMESTPAARAHGVLDIENDILARQVIGQRLAVGRPFGGGLGDHRTAFPDMANIGVKVFERQRQLVGIEPFGTAAELRPLELPDDRLQALDLPSRLSTTAAMSRTRRCRSSGSEGRSSRSINMANSTMNRT